MFGQLAAMRGYIVKNSLNKLGKEDQLFFYANNRIINANTKGRILYDSLRDTLDDGWLIISYTKEATFGNN